MEIQTTLTGAPNSEVDLRTLTKPVSHLSLYTEKRDRTSLSNSYLGASWMPLLIGPNWTNRMTRKTERSAMKPSPTQSWASIKVELLLKVGKPTPLWTDWGSNFWLKDSGLRTSKRLPRQKTSVWLTSSVRSKSARIRATLSALPKGLVLLLCRRKARWGLQPRTSFRVITLDALNKKIMRRCASLNDAWMLNWDRNLESGVSRRQSICRTWSCVKAFKTFKTRILNIIRHWTI